MITYEGLIIGLVIAILLAIWQWWVKENLSSKIRDLEYKYNRTDREKELEHNASMDELQKVNDKKVSDILLANKDERINEQKRLQELEIVYQQNSVKQADERFEKLKANELIATKKSIEEATDSRYKLLFQQWKDEATPKIRQDAINSSAAVIKGKVSEHLSPFIDKFPFNPKDARFIGYPIDLIVFDGYSDNKDEIVIYIVEVKTGKQYLSAQQQMIKKAVENKRIYWLSMRIDNGAVSIIGDTGKLF